MNKKLVLILLGLMIFGIAYATQEVLVLSFTLTNNDNITLNSIKLDDGTETTATGTEYSIVLLDESGVVIQTTYFDATFTAYGDEFPTLPGQDSGIGIEIDLDEIDLLIRVPYTSQASSYEIRKGSTVLFSESIELCNNDGTCDVSNGENYLSCWSDCPSASSDDYCDGIFDNTCDSDCTNQGRSYIDPDCTCGDGICDGREDTITCSADCGAPSNMITNLLITIIAVVVGVPILIIVIIVILVKKLKKNKKPKKEEKK